MQSCEPTFIFGDEGASSASEGHFIRAVWQDNAAVGKLAARHFIEQRLHRRLRATAFYRAARNASTSARIGADGGRPESPRHLIAETAAPKR